MNRMSFDPAAAVDSDSDAELTALLRRVQERCPVSFERLYSLTCRQLFGIVCRINHQRAEAEEVLQEVYLKVWTQGAQFEGRKGRPIHWLSAIAHHAAIDSLRRRSVRPDGLAGANVGHSHIDTDADTDPYQELPSPDPQPLERLIQATSADAVQHRLAALSSDQRESLTLAFFDGLSYPEIAQRMGRSPSTVKSWVRRSLIGMRTGLCGYR